MKIGDYVKKSAAVAAGAVERALEDPRRREAIAARAAWDAQLLEAQRQFRATHPPGTRVPMPRFLGLPWPPPPAVGQEIEFTSDEEAGR